MNSNGTFPIPKSNKVNRNYPSRLLNFSYPPSTQANVPPAVRESPANVYAQRCYKQCSYTEKYTTLAAEVEGTKVKMNRYS